MTYEPFPQMLQVETATKCNATCFICPNSQIKRAPMETAVFKRIIDDCVGKGVREIHPFFTNEPLMERRLWEFMDYCDLHIPEAGIHLYTNASLLTERTARRLLGQPNFRFIAFSLDGATTDTFEMMRPGLQWAKVKENCDRFLALRLELGRSNDVHVKTVLTRVRQNEQDVEAFEAMWKGRVDEVMVHGSDGRAGIGFNQDEGGERAGWWKNDPRWPCRAHRCHHHSMYILSTGECVPCCKDWNGATVIGNITEASVEEVWNSDSYAAIRRKLDAGVFDEAACKLCPLLG